MKQPFKLVISIFICELVGIISTPFTIAAIPTWYATLHKPSFSPPNWIFGPVWTILYALMGISAYLIWIKGAKSRKIKVALCYFSIQLFCNFLWSVLFFGLHNPLLGLIDIVALWVAIVCTIRVFYPLSKPAAYLLLPYILWVSFAMILNLSIVLQQKQNSPIGQMLNPSMSPTISSGMATLMPTQVSNGNANITVSSPQANQHVTLPIVIKGKARVFENQFNYRVRGVNGVIILEGSAYANSPDIGQFGDFVIRINSIPTMRSNMLTLEVFDYSAKDGSERDLVSIPVIFDPSNSIPISAYFGGKQAPAGQECTTVYPLEHHIAKTQGVARAALEELLNGPMIIESKNGYYTSINDGVKIQKLTIENGVAKVDFNKGLEEGVAGSCKVTAIRTQIVQTLKQFSTVKDVVISIDGRIDDILQP